MPVRIRKANGAAIRGALGAPKPPSARTGAILRPPAVVAPPVSPQIEPQVPPVAAPPAPAAMPQPARRPRWLTPPRLARGDRIVLALLVGALVVGAALRLANLTGVPAGFNQDEADAGYEAYSLLHTGRDHLGHPFNLLGTESYGDWPPPMQIFFTVPFVALFGLKVWAVRAATVFAGLLVIPAVYLLGVQLFGRRGVGVLAAWLIAALPWAVHAGRFALQASMAPLAEAALLLALVWLARRQSEAGAIWAALAAVFALASYHTFRLQVPLIGLAALVAFAPRLLRVRPWALVTGAVIVLSVAVPTAIFVVGDEAGGARMRQVSIFAANSPLLPPGTKVDLAFVVGRYLGYFSPDFLFRSGDGDPTHMLPDTGILPWVLLPFLLAGLVRLGWAIARPRDGWERPAALFTVGMLLLYPFPGALTLPSPQTLRAGHALPLFALIAALGALALGDALRAWLPATWPAARRWAPIAAGMLIAELLAVEAGIQYHEYFTTYRVETAPAYQAGLLPAVSYALANQAAYDQIWILNSNQPYMYVLFAGKWAPGAARQVMDLRRQPPNFNQVVALGKFRFPDPSGNLPADLVQASYQTVTQTTYPGGHVAYRLVAATIPNRGRVLVIFRPK